MKNEKIAVSVEENSIESPIDQRFGRCKHFLIIEIESDKIKQFNTVKNEGALQGHGAGIRAAKQMGEIGVKTVITGDLGPNATNILNSLKISAFHASGNANDAVNLFIKGELKKIIETVTAHSGISKKEGKMGERIFFPLLDNEGLDSRISDHFGHAPFFGIYDVEKEVLEIIENDVDHSNPAKSPIDQIEEAVNPTSIFARGIGKRAIDIIAEKGLSLKTGPFNTVKEIVENLDKLEEQTQSCGH